MFIFFITQVPTDESVKDNVQPVVVTEEDPSSLADSEVGAHITIQDVIKSLINFLTTKQNQPLWSYEDITAKVGRC